MRFAQMSDYIHLDTDFFRDALASLYPHIGVVFVAIEGDDFFDVFQEDGDTIFRIPVPFEEIQYQDRQIPVMTEHLLRALEKADWLDYEEIRGAVMERLLEMG